MTMKPLQAPGDGRQLARVDLQDLAAIPPILGLIFGAFAAIRKWHKGRMDRRKADSDRLERIEGTLKTVAEEVRLTWLNQSILAEEFKIAAEGSPSPIWQADPDGMVIASNAAMSEIFDRPAQDLLGDGWQGLVDADDLPNVENRWKAAVHGATPFTAEFDVQGKRVRMSAIAVKDTAGAKPFRFVGTAKVIHAQ